MYKILKCGVNHYKDIYEILFKKVENSYEFTYHKVILNSYAKAGSVYI